MKIIKALSIAMIAMTTLAACSKDNDDTPAPFVIEGVWAGKIGTGSNTPTGQYALNIKSGGALDRVGSSGSVSASGTWQLNGNNFTATYTYPSGTVVTLQGTVDKAKYKITANWENNGGEEGTLYANKE